MTKQCRGGMTRNPKLSFRLPNLAYIVSANDPAFDESGARRHCSKLLGRLWHRPRELMYSNGISAEDSAEIVLQRERYQKWSENGDGDLRCIVVRDLQLPLPGKV